MLRPLELNQFGVFKKSLTGRLSGDYISIEAIQETGPEKIIFYKISKRRFSLTLVQRIYFRSS